MGRISLNRNDDWQVEHKRQDIRGWVVHDASGQTVGRVRDLIADTDSGVVESIVLDSGQEFPANTVEVGYDDQVVHLASAHAARQAEDAGGSTPEAYRDARIREREHGSAKE